MRKASMEERRWQVDYYGIGMNSWFLIYRDKERKKYEYKCLIHM
jgi:hypothetical protein